MFFNQWRSACGWSGRSRRRGSQAVAWHSSGSCLDLPGCHSQGENRDETLANIREAIALWLEVEAEEAGVKSVETLELAL